MGTMPVDAVGHEGGLPLKSAARKVLQAELVERGDLLPVTVEGIRGTRFVAADDIARLDQAEHELATGEPPGGCPPGVAFLAPLDPLVWDREMLRTLFGFDYIWEVYVPGPKRRWGYYVLPILFGDRLVGRINPRADRKAGVLEIVDLWWEDGVDAIGVEGLVDALAEALEAHRRFTGMKGLTLPTSRRHRDLVRQLRGRTPVRPGAASARTT